MLSNYAYAPTLIAHRCGTVYGPENITSTAVKAVRAGVTGLEIDIRMSKDGTPWLMHDWGVDRTTNGAGGVIQLTDKQLLKFTIDGTGGKERIPTLYEFLRDVLAVNRKVHFVLHFQPGEWKPANMAAINARLVNVKADPSQVTFASWLPDHLEGWYKYGNPKVGRLLFLPETTGGSAASWRVSPYQTACMPPPSQLSIEAVAQARMDNNDVHGSAGPAYWQTMIDCGVKTNMLNDPNPYWLWLGQRADGSV